MTITVSDMHDLIQILTLHPEWRTELRRLTLTDDLLSLPQVVRELAEAQQRTEQRLERLEATVQALAEAQQRAEQRLERLEATVQALAEAQQRTEQRVDRLADRLSQLQGHDLERRDRERAGAYLGRWLWPVTALTPDALRETLEARLDAAEVEEVMDLDMLVQGRARRLPGSPEVWLAVEVSTVVDRADIERARRRAALLQQAGLRAIPAVAGEQLTEGAEALTGESPLIVMRDGHSQGWEQALQDAD